MRFVMDTLLVEFDDDCACANGLFRGNGDVVFATECVQDPLAFCQIV
jgi:hypothetical protein